MLLTNCCLANCALQCEGDHSQSRSGSMSRFHHRAACRPSHQRQLANPQRWRRGGLRRRIALVHETSTRHARAGHQGARLHRNTKRRPTQCHTTPRVVPHSPRVVPHSAPCGATIPPASCPTPPYIVPHSGPRLATVPPYYSIVPQSNPPTDVPQCAPSCPTARRHARGRRKRGGGRREADGPHSSAETTATNQPAAAAAAGSLWPRTKADRRRQ